jgi:hypothetical protein
MVSIAGAITLTADMRKELRDGYIWIGWRQISRRLAYAVKIGSLIWVAAHWRQKQENSTETLEVLDVNESRFLCRLHAVPVADVAKARAA